MQSLTTVFTISYHTLIQLLPYIVLGVVLSEMLKFVKWFDYLKAAPGKAPGTTIILSALLGVFSPLCTYGAVPMIISLFSMGFPLYPLVTFLIASSLMNPQLFLLTWGGIGLEFALARVAAALLFSLLFGLAVQLLNPKWIVNPNVQNSEKAHHAKVHKFTWRTFLKSNLKTMQFIGFYIVIGILLGAVIEVYVPSKWFLALFQSRQWLGVLLGAVLGVPLYACGGGAIPLVKSMMINGMSNGAALAFFLVGPATRVAPLMALATIIRARFLVLYISALIIFAVAVGLLYTVIS